MTQEILIPELTAVNPSLLDSQLKAAAPNDCYGIVANRDDQGNVSQVKIVVSDTITAQLLATLKSIALAHDANQQTPAQQAEAAGRADIADLLTKADTALSQLASKRATFAGTPNLANAAPLLLEVTDDLIAAIKVLKYIVKRIN